MNCSDRASPSTHISRALEVAPSPGHSTALIQRQDLQAAVSMLTRQLDGRRQLVLRSVQQTNPPRLTSLLGQDADLELGIAEFIRQLRRLAELIRRLGEMSQVIENAHA